MDRPQAVAWSGKTVGVAATRVWRFEELDEGTLVRTEEAFAGVLARLSPR